MSSEKTKNSYNFRSPAVLPDGNGGFTPISNSKDYHNVVENLKRFRGLPRIHICRKTLYPKKAILEWVERQIGVGK